MNVPSRVEKINQYEWIEKHTKKSCGHRPVQLSCLSPTKRSRGQKSKAQEDYSNPEKRVTWCKDEKEEPLNLGIRQSSESNFRSCSEIELEILDKSGASLRVLHHDHSNSVEGGPERCASVRSPASIRTPEERPHRAVRI